MSVKGRAPGLRRRVPDVALPWPWPAAALALFVLVGAAAFVLPTQLFLALLGGAALVLVWMVWPETIVLGLLLIRSSVDGLLELFTLFAGSPLSMTASGILNTVAVGLGVLTVARRWLGMQRSAERRSLLAAPSWSYALFLCVALLSIPGSIDAVGGIKEWARLASGLAVYVMVAAAVDDEQDVRRFLLVIMASSLIPLGVALMQQLTGSGFFFLGFVGTEFAYRPRGTLFHPATLGSYLVLLLAVAAAVYFSTSHKGARLEPGTTRWRALLLAWSGVGVGVLALTMARTQWLGMMATATVLGLLKRRRLAILALVIALVLFWAFPLLRERLSDPSSTRWRLDLWQAGVTLIWPPLARGVGPAMVGYGLATSPWHINQLLPKVTSPPHNDYLKVAIEMGALGLLAYGTWLACTVGYLWRAYRRATERAIVWRALALLAVTLAGMVMSVSDNYLSYTAVQWYFWALIALVPHHGQWPPVEPVRQ